MQIVVHGLAERLGGMGIDLHKPRNLELLDTAIHQRVRAAVGWSYDEDEDVLIVDLPDPSVPDFTRFGEIVEVRYGGSAG